MSELFNGGFAQRALRVGTRLIKWDQAKVRKYLATHAVPALQIGSGSNKLKGWLNSDSYPYHPWEKDHIFLNASYPFPLPDESFEYVYSEHVIEHMTYAAGSTLLRESFRVLKPGGRIRISTPDMAFLVALLSTEPGELERSYIEFSARHLRDGEPVTALSVVNNFVRDWGHTYIYDRAGLEAALVAAGFTDIACYSVSDSDDPMLRAIDNSARFPDPRYLELESLVLEGTRPA